MKQLRHQADVCVVGGGMAGVCAALAAARHGAKVVLIHDRPVLGGNTSSEIRIHICGADRNNRIPNMRETGILEELRLDNLLRNPHQNYSIWDLVLYEKVHFQPNLTLLSNCTCLKAETAGTRIANLTGWQLTTETYHTVEARVFIDCSGDGLLAPLTGAQHRIGREARSEFNESIAPEQADKQTMGMTCMFHAARHDTPQPFEPPAWAHDFPREEDLPYGTSGHDWVEMGYWWVEVGGEHDSIHDTEKLRDELLKIVFGVWDHIKNHGDHGADNWALDWIGFLPGKRESRRCVGDHILTQNDVEAEGRFEDVVAYGGWPMDDHHPAGFWAVKLGAPATIFHPAPSPYGIPYRCLYSRNIDNLMFAGRCASFTHAALSSTRVSGTASVLGQAAGTAAAMATARQVTVRQIGQRHIVELQQALLRDDCYLPRIRQEFSALTTSAELTASRGDPSPVRDGTSRPVGDEVHAWTAGPGDWIAYRFDSPRTVNEVSLVLDSGFDKKVIMSLHGSYGQVTRVPDVTPKDFRIEVFDDGSWRTLHEVRGNHQRLVRLPIGRTVEGVRFTLMTTWGAPESRIYAFYLD